MERGLDWMAVELLLAPFLLGGAPRRRLERAWDWFSYSTDVLRGNLVRVEPEAHCELEWSETGMAEVAAWTNAVAMLTEVSGGGDGGKGRVERRRVLKKGRRGRTFEFLWVMRRRCKVARSWTRLCSGETGGARVVLVACGESGAFA